MLLSARCIPSRPSYSFGSLQVYTQTLIQCDSLKGNSLPYLQSSVNIVVLSDTIVGNRAFR